MRFVGTVDLPVADLRPYPGNPRVHDEAALDESIAATGQYRAIVARRLGDGAHEILAGHGTRNAVARAGLQSVRVEVIEADDTEARRIVLADNRTSELASYDDSALLALLDSASRDGGLVGTGYDAEAYRDLLDALGSGNPHDWQPPVDPDDQDVTPPDEPVTRPGDVWVLGEHRLVCGDSTDPTVWEALLPGGARVECVWTDPPYGVAYVGKTGDALTIQNDALDADGLGTLLSAALGQAVEACRPGSPWYVAAPPGPLHTTFAEVLTRLGVYRQQIIWVKDQFVLGHADYHYRHEPIFYGYTPGAKGRRGRGGTGWHGDNCQDTAWEIPRPQRSADHPTMKPLELVTRALSNSTKRGAVVADPFAGSGTTLIACEATDRKARVIELDPRYCDVIARRWQEVTGGEPVLEATGEPHYFTRDADAEPAETDRG